MMVSQFSLTKFGPEILLGKLTNAKYIICRSSWYPYTSQQYLWLKFVFVNLKLADSILLNAQVVYRCWVIL